MTEKRERRNEGVELVANAGGLTSVGLRLVRLLRHLGSPSRRLLQIPQYTPPLLISTFHIVLSFPLLLNYEISFLVKF